VDLEIPSAHGDGIYDTRRPWEEILDDAQVRIATLFTHSELHPIGDANFYRSDVLSCSG
jgi:hypothetical protein